MTEFRALAAITSIRLVGADDGTLGSPAFLPRAKCGYVFRGSLD